MHENSYTNMLMPHGRGRRLDDVMGNFHIPLQSPGIEDSLNMDAHAPSQSAGIAESLDLVRQEITTLRNELRVAMPDSDSRLVQIQQQIHVLLSMFDHLSHEGRSPSMPVAMPLAHGSSFVQENVVQHGQRCSLLAVNGWDTTSTFLGGQNPLNAESSSTQQPRHDIMARPSLPISAGVPVALQPPYVPRTKTIEDAVRFWAEGDLGEGLVVPIKDWHESYPRKAYKSQDQKIKNIRDICQELAEHFGGSIPRMKERYPCHRMSQLIKELRTARVERGLTKRRSRKGGSVSTIVVS